ncbi:hypothetical protein GCM10020229_27440 [Kitasatospora albolonga]
MCGSPSAARGWAGDEDHLGAAVRELREETTLALPAGRFGTVAWTRRAFFTYDGQAYDQREEYRLVRITAAEAGRIRVDSTEATHGHHWWTLDELAATEETVYPSGWPCRSPSCSARGRPNCPCTWATSPKGSIRT